MIKFILITVLIFAFSGRMFSQFYTEDFTSGGAGWGLSNNGPGMNAMNANVWVINNTGNPSCNGANGQYLHITCDPLDPFCGLFGGPGLVYNAGGISPCATDRFASSPNISTVGQTGISLTFEYTANGESVNDYGLVRLSDDGGVTWIDLPTQYSGNLACQSANIPIPVAYENIANFRIAFRWINNDNSAGADPPFSIDNIALTSAVTAPCTPPTLSTSLTDEACPGGNNGAIDLTVTGSSTYTYSWTGGTTATTEDIMGLAGGSYTVVVTDATDPTCTATTMVTINTGSGVTATANTSANNVCAGDPITLTGGGASTYSWNNGVIDGVTFSAPTMTTTYTVTATAGACTDTETITITIIPCVGPNTALSATSTNLCIGDCIDFTDLSTNIPPGSLLGWNFPGATPANSTPTNPNNAAPTNICYNTAGNYWATIVYTDATLNVIDSTGIAITVTGCTTPDANIDIITPGPYCIGDCISFASSSVFQTPATFVWDFGNGSNSNQEVPSGPICYPIDGTYTVSLTVSDASGSNTETQMITIVNCATPTSSFSLSNNDLCENDCITFTNTSIGATSYAWTFEGGTPATSTNQDPGVVCFNTQGVYNVSLIATNIFGNDSITDMVTVAESPNVIAYGDTSITVTQTTPVGVLNPDPSLDYIWTPNIGIECNFCPETNVTPLDTMFYYVTATNAAGCSSSDSVFIQVEIIEGIGIPNAFSPNNDGFNDILSVQGFGITEMTFSIYNQYGQKVFEGFNQSSGWDGTFQGSPVNPGVFVYVLVYNTGGAEDLILKGNVTLVK